MKREFAHNLSVAVAILLRFIVRNSTHSHIVVCRNEIKTRNMNIKAVAIQNG